MGGLIAASAALVILAPAVIHSVDGHQNARSEWANPLPATDGEQRDILKALLKESPYLESTSPPPSGVERADSFRQRVILLDTSAAFCESEFEESAFGATRDCTLSLPNHIASSDFSGEIPKDLLENLILSNLEYKSLPTVAWPDVTISPRGVIDRIFDGGGWWNDFYKEFPDASGFLEVSRAVLTADGNHAVIYAGYHCGGLCGIGTIHLMTRKDDVWQISESVDIWVS